MTEDQDQLSEWARATVQAVRAAAKRALSQGHHTEVGPLDGRGVPTHFALTSTDRWQAKTASADMAKYEAYILIPGGGHMRISGSPGDGWRADAVATHTAANDPRATITRCDADMATLNEHRGRQIRFGYCCEVCVFDMGEPYEEHELAPCRTVRLLAWGLRFHAPGYPGPEEMPQC